MTNRIIYRGPDSDGVYINSHIGLGIRRLKIIDLKTGDQPISNEDDSITVVFNGEIYNYKHMREQLLKKGHKLKTTSDTETLVHLYEDHGLDFVQNLNGMFAFALWDAQKQSLLLARDHAGIKPLFYFRSSCKIIFGSEIKTILQNIPAPDIDPDSLFLYSYLGYVPTPRTIFKNIFQLLPGHSLSFSSTGEKVHKYYDVYSQKQPAETDLDKLLDTVVARQAIADVPVGLLLSGGLDSSVLAYYLTRQKRNVKSFSISFSDTPNYDEAPYARQVADLLGTHHFEEQFTPADIIKDFPEIQSKLDQPFADPSLFPTFYVSRLAARHVKVALSGDGGDETFAGYPTYLGHRFARFIPWYPDFLRTASSQLSESLNFKFPLFSPSYSFGSALAGFVSGLGLPPAHRHLQWMIYQATSQIAPSRLFSMFHLKPGSPQLIDFQTYLLDDLLVKTDRASMYNSLEVRVPYLDREVIAYAFARQTPFIGLFTTKLPLRNLLAGKLPENIRRRPKKGFGIPLADWLSGPLSNLVHDYTSRTAISEYFPSGFVSGLWQDKKYKTLWMVFMFSAWQEKWLK